MKLNTTYEDKVCTLAVEGDIDTLTAPELEKAIDEASSKCEKMIIDMSGVDYISSGGLRVIVGANHKLGKDNLTIVGMAPNVYEIFRLTGFTKFLTIE